MPGDRRTIGLRGFSSDSTNPMQTSPQLIESPGYRPSRRIMARLAAFAMLALGTGLGLTAAPASAAGCDYVASTSGSDQAAGSATAPFRTVQHLVSQLSAGQTGCLRAGTYNENVTFSHSGAAAAPITLTSYPGDVRPTVIGRMWLPSGSDYVTVSNLGLVGVNSGNLPSPTVDDAHASFIGNDVTDNHTAICFDLGDDTGTYGTAHDVLIQGNRIHHCGVMPAANHDHGIYVEEAVNTHILDNIIYDNADRGVQLYPDSRGTLIEGNVIDSNGEGIIFSGDFGRASSDNVVENNVITNSSLRNNVESWYPTGNPVGQSNIVKNNCIEGGARAARNGGVDTSGGGFTATDNVVADPHYANPSAGDYTVSPSSPCAAILAGAPAPSQTPPPPPQATPPPLHTGTPPPPTGGHTPKYHHHAGPAHSARSLTKLLLIARVSPRDRRLLVHGRLASTLLTGKHKVVVLTRIGHHWRVVGYRVLSQHATFTLNVRLGRTALHRNIQVRAKVLGGPYQRTIRAHVA